MNRLSNSGFCFSIGLHRNSLVFPSGGMFRRRVLDALESAKKDCSLGAQFYWRTVLPNPAPPPRRAPRRDMPVVFPGFGRDRYGGITAVQTWVLFFRRFDIRIRMLALPKKGSRHFFRIAGEQKRGFVSWLRPAPPPCCARPRPKRPVVCLACGFDTY